MPQTPPPFAMVLRKYLKNARMTAVRQLGFDRVWLFDFDTKFGVMHLYVEVFREGNVILVDSEGIIIQPLTHAKYSGRVLKKEWNIHRRHQPQTLMISMSKHYRKSLIIQTVT